jgi:hypothetical protein
LHTLPAARGPDGFDAAPFAMSAKLRTPDFLKRRLYWDMENLGTRRERGGLKIPIAQIAVARDPCDASGCPSSAKVEIQ